MRIFAWGNMLAKSLKKEATLVVTRRKPLPKPCLLDIRQLSIEFESLRDRVSNLEKTRVPETEDHAGKPNHRLQDYADFGDG